MFACFGVEQPSSAPNIEQGVTTELLNNNKST